MSRHYDGVTARAGGTARGQRPDGVGRAEGFTAAIAGLAADPARRAQFGTTARVAIEGRTWGAVGDDLIEH